MSWRRACLVACVVVAACTKAPAPQTSTELGVAIDAYERNEPGASEERIKALFARLDAEIALLKADELAQPADKRADIAARRKALEDERARLQATYLRARVARLGGAAEEALKSMGDQLGQGLEEAGRALRESMRDEAPE